MYVINFICSLINEETRKVLQLVQRKIQRADAFTGH